MAVRACGRSNLFDPMNLHRTRLRCGPCHRLDSATRTIRNRQHSVDDLDAGEWIIVHACELSEFAGIVDAREACREIDSMRIAQPCADMGAHAISDLTGLADTCRRNGVAQAPELLDLQAHGIDDA